jgi:hypothetical protein
MDQAPRVQRGQRGGHLAGVPRSGAIVEPALMAEILPLEQLHHVVRSERVGAVVVDLHDVRVLDGGERVVLELEE